MTDAVAPLQDDGGIPAVSPPLGSSLGSSGTPEPATPAAAPSDDLTADEADRAERRRRQAREASKRSRDKKRAAKATDVAKAELAEREQALERDGAALIEIAADVVHLLALHPDDPRFGESRSVEMSQRWAKLLAPYYDPEQMELLKYLPWAFASAGTAKILRDYADEVRDARATSRRVVNIKSSAPADEPAAEATAGEQ